MFSFYAYITSNSQMGWFWHQQKIHVSYLASDRPHGRPKQFHIYKYVQNFYSYRIQHAPQHSQ